MLTERDAFRAARYFLEQFNERERSHAFSELITWMEEGTWVGDPSTTADPAQWRDWVASVDRVITDRALATVDHHVTVTTDPAAADPAQWRWSCSCGAASDPTRFASRDIAQRRARAHIQPPTGQ